MRGPPRHYADLSDVQNCLEIPGEVSKDAADKLLYSWQNSSTKLGSMQSQAELFSAQGDYSFVILPDTQYTVQYYPLVWRAMVQWILDHIESHNITAVLGLGDVTDTGAESAYIEGASGWQSFMDAGLVCVPVIGNHDYYTKLNHDVTVGGCEYGGIGSTCLSRWDTYFGESFFAGKSWYGACQGSSTQNYYVNYSIGSHNYIFLALCWLPQTADLEWAAAVIAANPSKEIIVLTHYYLDDVGTRKTDIWNALCNPYDNVMIIGGHIGEYWYRRDLNANRKFVDQFLFDYQNYDDPNIGAGNGGYIVLMNGELTTNKKTVTAYSVHEDTYILHRVMS